MRQIYLRLKRISFVKLLSIVVILIVIINSCKKDLNLQQTDRFIDVTNARVWYQKTYPAVTAGNLHTSSVNADNTITDFSQFTAPDWDKASTYTRYGEEVIEMPLTNPEKFGIDFKIGLSNTTAYPKACTRNSFLLLKDSVGYRAYVMTIAADSAYLKGDFSKLDHNHYNKRDSDFSGMVIYHTPKGELINGWVYRKGKVVNALTANPTSGEQQNLSTKPQYKVQADKKKSLSIWLVCTDYYEVVTYDGHPTTGPHYTGTVCKVINLQDGGGGDVEDPTGGAGGYDDHSGGDPCAGVYDTDPDGGFNGPVGDPHHPTQQGCTVAIVKTQAIITNKITDSCLNAMVDGIVNKNIRFNIKETLNSIFSTNNDFNLDFRDSVLATNIDGVTDLISGNTQYGGLNIQIALNSSTLPNASKEFIASTILHESLHAYFRYNNATFDHQVMSTNYIGWFRTAMKNMFPNISDYDNESLAWGGLYSTFEWSQKDSSSKNFMININNSYKAGTTGEKCK